MSEHQLSREEIAQLEVGRTDISSRASWALIGLFLLTIGAVPITQHVHEVAQHSRGERQDALPQAYDVFRGLGAVAAPFGEAGRSLYSSVFRANALLLRRINEYEDALEDASLLSKGLLPPTQLLMARFLGVGNENAYCGRGRWLFYRPGVDYLTGPGFLEPKQLARRAAAGNEWNPPPQPDPRKAILQFRRQLGERGIELIVMPTPVKPMIHPEKLTRRCREAPTPIQNPSFTRLRKELEEGGVNVFDVGPAIAQARKAADLPQYLATDTHWRPETVELVARRLAEFIGHQGTGIPEQTPARYVRERKAVKNLGDMAVMLNLPEDQALYGKQEVSVQQVTTKEGDLWRSDPEADILFLGDSFSNIYSLSGMGWGSSAGLVEQLSFALQRPIDRIVRNDAGAYATRQIISHELARGRDCLSGKKLVIWQFAARELAVGDWKLLEMKQIEEQRPRTPAIPEGALVVQGKMKKVAPVPKPRTVPYKDCITSIHLAELKVMSGEHTDGQALVFVWGMKNNKWTKAAQLKPGEALKLHLTPWQEVEGKYGSYNRMELDDDELLLLDPYWGEIIQP